MNKFSTFSLKLCSHVVKYKTKFALAVTATALSLYAFPVLTAHAGTWQEDSVGWWWQEDDGRYPVNAWKWIDGNNDGTAECYCFDNRGYMYSNTVTPDGYQVNASGAWEDNGVIQTKIVDLDQEANTIGEESTNQAVLVPINLLANKNSLKQRCTDAEFQAAYDVAVPIVSQVVGSRREEQLYWIARVIRSFVEGGQVSYSMSSNHYSDPYGYLVLG